MHYQSRSEDPPQTFYICGDPGYASAHHIETSSLEAAVCECSSKEAFLKISQNSQKNTCVRVSF